MKVLSASKLENCGGKRSVQDSVVHDAILHNRGYATVATMRATLPRSMWLYTVSAKTARPEPPAAAAMYSAMARCNRATASRRTGDPREAAARRRQGCNNRCRTSAAAAQAPPWSEARPGQWAIAPSRGSERKMERPVSPGNARTGCGRTNVNGLSQNG